MVVEALIPVTKYSSVSKGKTGRCDLVGCGARVEFCVLTPQVERSRAACLGHFCRKAWPTCGLRAIQTDGVFRCPFTY